MGLRLGLIAVLGALSLALARVGRLVESSPDQAPAVLVLAIAALIGAIVTQSMRTLRLGLPARLAVGAAGALLLIARLTAPETMIGGLIPTGTTAAAVTAQMTVALELIRFGSAPVAASPGLVAVLAAVFWTLGSLATGALAAHRYLLSVVPILGFYLLSATFDRQPPAWWHPLSLIVTGAIALLASARAGGGGRVRLAGSTRPLPAHHRAVPALFIAGVALTGTFSTFQFASAVPESGMVAWRNPTGFGGSLFGGFSYNLFASMQQDLAANSDVVLFLARVSESAPTNSELYWKLISLDTFDGSYWLPGNLGISRPASPAQWEAPDFAWRGNQVRVESVVLIQNLRQNYLPVLYSPRGVESDNSILMGSYRTREDGSLKFDARTQEGLIYRVTSDLPIPDLAVLATEGGELSPLFANAQAEGAFTLPATQVPRPNASTRLTTLYTALPDDLPPSIAGLARQVTARTSTDFERALVLEEFFRNAGGFVYDANASTGHSSLKLEDWLLVPSSRNYRSGYCEQFATAMAVMARALDIPARVVIGFAPGTIQTQSDGTEVIVVRARDAHAWVEVYLEGQGWVRFDPTPRSDGSNPATAAQVGFTPTEYLPAPADPSDATSELPGSIDTIDSRFLDPDLEGTVGDVETPPAPGFSPLWLLPLGMVALIPMAKSVRRVARMVRLGRGEIASGWAEFTDRLADLGWQPSLAQTPIELARMVDEGGSGSRPLANRLTASVFGNRSFSDGKSAFQMAERALRSRYSAWRWWLTWLQPRTLWSRALGPRIWARLEPKLRIR